MMSNSQSVTNRKRLDQRVTDLEAICNDTFIAIAEERDQIIGDFVRLIEIMGGLLRVKNLLKQKFNKQLDFEEQEYDLERYCRYLKMPARKRLWWRIRGWAPEEPEGMS